MKEDSQKAIEYDNTYYKAFLRYGEACVEIGKRGCQTDLVIMDEGI